MRKKKYINFLQDLNDKNIILYVGKLCFHTLKDLLDDIHNQGVSHEEFREVAKTKFMRVENGALLALEDEDIIDLIKDDFKSYVLYDDLKGYYIEVGGNDE